MSDNKEFNASLEKAKAIIISRLIANTKTALLVIETDAKKNCSVDMGILRASIHSDVAVTQNQIKGVVASNLEYAPYVHQGTGIYAIDGNGRKTPWAYKAEAGKYKGWHITRGQKPQPFLENAKLQNMNKIPEILAGK